MALLEAYALDVAVAGQRVCRSLDLCIAPGDRWCLLGRNGVGKTTLLLTLAGLRRPDGGQLLVQGSGLDRLAPRARARRIGLLPQDHNDMFPASALETVLAARHPWLTPWQWERATDLRIAQDALAAVGLGGFETRDIATLSGGERRRLGIATLLAQQTQLQLLDEPVNHLDIHQQVHMLDLLARTPEGAGSASMMVLHDLNLAARFCDKFLLLFGNGTHAQGTHEILDATHLQRLYNHPLIRIDTASGPLWLPELPPHSAQENNASNG